MSYADGLCEELYNVEIKKPCCRRAFVGGALLDSASLEKGCVTVSTARAGAAELFCAHLSTLYAKETSIEHVGNHGHVTHRVSVCAPAALKLSRQLMAAGASVASLLRTDACESCRSAFLRGVFFANGTVNDPQKSSHMEFLFRNPTSAASFADFLSDLGYPPRLVARKDRTGVYFKDSTSVGDMLTMMGAHSMIFDFYNTRIERDIRNNENRATNCVARNIGKSIAAASIQMDAIGELMESGKFEALPEALRVTAMLRYRNPDATLDDLKDMHVPPISKSGLNHRLQKILEAANKK